MPSYMNGIVRRRIQFLPKMSRELIDEVLCGVVEGVVLYRCVLNLVECLVPRKKWKYEKIRFDRPEHKTKKTEQKSERLFTIYIFNQSNEITMKLLLQFYLISSFAITSTYGASCSETMEFALDTSAMKLLFDGFQPTVNR